MEQETSAARSLEQLCNCVRCHALHCLVGALSTCTLALGHLGLGRVSTQQRSAGTRTRGCAFSCFAKQGTTARDDTQVVRCGIPERGGGSRAQRQRRGQQPTSRTRDGKCPGKNWAPQMAGHSPTRRGRGQDVRIPFACARALSFHPSLPFWVSTAKARAPSA